MQPSGGRAIQQGNRRPPERARISVRCVGERVALPGGLVVEAPDPGHMISIPMDAGYMVRVEHDEGATRLTVEAPAGVPAPADDARIESLAEESRRSLSDDDEETPEARALREAWTYRRAFCRLTASFPSLFEERHTAVRWLTLSFQGTVRVPGLGAVPVVDGATTSVVIDGHTVITRRVGFRERRYPPGAVEVIVETMKDTDENTQPGTSGIRSSSKAVRLPD